MTPRRRWPRTIASAPVDARDVPRTELVCEKCEDDLLRRERTVAGHRAPGRCVPRVTPHRPSPVSARTRRRRGFPSDAPVRASDARARRDGSRARAVARAVIGPRRLAIGRARAFGIPRARAVRPAVEIPRRVLYTPPTRDTRDARARRPSHVSARVADGRARRPAPRRVFLIVPAQHSPRAPARPPRLSASCRVARRPPYDEKKPPKPLRRRRRSARTPANRWFASDAYVFSLALACLLVVAAARAAAVAVLSASRR